MLENTVTLYIRVSKCTTTKNACAHVSTRQPWLHIMLSYTLDLSPCSVTPPQDHVDVGTSTRQSHLHGVAFPIDQDALHALQQLGNKELAYVRLVSFLPSPSPFPSSSSLFLFPPYPSPSPSPSHLPLLLYSYVYYVHLVLGEICLFL